MSGDQSAQSKASTDGQTVRIVDHFLTHPFGREVDFDQALVGPGELEKFYAPLRQAGAQFGLTVDAPRPVEQSHGDIGAYVSRNGMIIRRVSLASDWNEHDYGTVIIRDGDGGWLLARRNWRGYHVPSQEADTAEIEPRWHPISKALAEVQTSQPVWAITPKLPEEIESPWALARFGFRGNTRWIVIGFTLGLVAGILAMATPVATQWIWDDAVPFSDSSLVLGIAAFLVAAALSSIVLTAISALAQLRVTSRYESFVRPAVLTRIMELPAVYFRKHPIGLVWQQSQFVEALFSLTTSPLFSLFRAIALGVPSALLLFWFSPTLATIAVLAVVVDVTQACVIAWRSAILNQRRMDPSSQLTTTTHDLIEGMPALRTSGAEARGLRHWAIPYYRRQRVTISIRHLQIISFVFTTVWPIVVTMILYQVTGTELLNSISPGSFLAFMTALGFFRTAMQGIPKMVDDLFLLPKYWTRVQPLLKSPPERPLSAIDPGEIRGAIRFEGVSFAYSDGPPELVDVSFTAEPGDFIAITGPSGAGKSTIIRMLIGLEPPSRGVVSIDGIDVEQLDIEAVRRQMGIVTQEMQPIDEEIRSLISGTAEIPDEKIWDVLDQVGMGDEVRNLPMGLHTLVGPNGSAFSGGQVQRLMVAGALVRKPRILVMDEATSALDASAQTEVTKAVVDSGATRVVVAHRLSTIINADKILVVSNGKLVEQGTYEELKEKNGVFTNLVANQEQHSGS